MALKDLLQKRAELIKQSRDLVDCSEKENRDFTAEEKAAYEKRAADISELDGRIDRVESQEKLESSLKEEKRGVFTQTAAAETKKPGNVRSTAEYHERFCDWLRGREVRDGLIQGTNADGGYIVPSEQFIGELLKNVDNLTFVRQRARKLQIVGAKTIGVPTIDADPSDPTWTTEIASVSADSALQFGKRTMTTHPLAKLVKVSRQLLRNSALPVDQIVRERLAYKIAVTQENGFLNGSGSGEPLGLFTASNDGVPTSRDISTDNTSTAPTFDGLINAVETLKPQYYPGAAWIFHRDAMKLLRKIKNGEGDYVFEPSVQAGSPDMLLGFPVLRSEYCPNTFTTQLYVGCLTNLAYYWVLDELPFEIQRLSELYAATNQEGFIARAEADGMPAIGEATVRVKLG